MTAIRVGIVDDHALVREGLRLILEGQPDFEVIGEAGDAVSALSLVAHRKPQIMLVDLTLDGSDGVALVRDLTAQHPRTRVIAVSMHHDEETVRQAFLAMADERFVTVDASRGQTEIAAAIAEAAKAAFHEKGWPWND